MALLVAIPLILLSGLAGLAALRNDDGLSSADGNGANPDAIQDDSHFFGQSPPVYPSPNITGRGSWATAFGKARRLVGNMTLEDKVTLTSGVSPNSGCVGRIAAVRSINFPGLCLGDAGQGLRGTDFVSSFASGIHVGAR
jgi:beta-glucosidase